MQYQWEDHPPTQSLLASFFGIKPKKRRRRVTNKPLSEAAKAKDMSEAVGELKRFFPTGRIGG